LSPSLSTSAVSSASSCAASPTASTSGHCMLSAGWQTTHKRSQLSPCRHATHLWRPIGSFLVVWRQVFLPPILTGLHTPTTSHTNAARRLSSAGADTGCWQHCRCHLRSARLVAVLDPPRPTPTRAPLKRTCR
jgi:hypothetical protein